MRVMASDAIQPLLAVGADLPFEESFRMASPAGFRRTVSRHGLHGVIGCSGIMAGLAGDPIFFPGIGGGIVTRHMAGQAFSRFPLVFPGFLKDRIVRGVPMSALFPSLLDRLMTGWARRRWRYAFLRLPTRLR